MRFCFFAFIRRPTYVCVCMCSLCMHVQPVYVCVAYGNVIPGHYSVGKILLLRLRSIYSVHNRIKK